MAKVAFLIVFLLSTTGYFLKVENDYIHNHLVCLFTSNHHGHSLETHLSKIKQSLPKNFPINRFDHLAKKQLALGKVASPISCNLDKKKEYEETVLYSYRPYLYPVFPDIFQTMALISATQKIEKIELHSIAAFKEIIEHERETFEEFVQDCSRIKEMIDQIRLLEKHLKIDKNERKPTQVSKTQNAESRMSKNIMKQISFAKKHLDTNEKLFSHKWKIYFEFEPEKTLCPR